MVEEGKFIQLCLTLMKKVTFSYWLDIGATKFRISIIM